MRSRMSNLIRSEPVKMDGNGGDGSYLWERVISRAVAFCTAESFVITLYSTDLK